MVFGLIGQAKYDASLRDKTLLGVSVSGHLKVAAVSPLIGYKVVQQ